MPRCASKLRRGRIIKHISKFISGTPLEFWQHNGCRYPGLFSHWSEEPEYTIYSSVTGNKITDLTLSGQKHITYVYKNGSVIAEQHYGTSSNSELDFKHTDPVTGSVRQTDTEGEISPGGVGRSDKEAFGASIPPPEEEVAPFDYRKGGNVRNPEAGCMLDMSNSIAFCQEIFQLMHTGGHFVSSGGIFIVRGTSITVMTIPV
jgi:hypothetical protein